MISKEALKEAIHEATETVRNREAEVELSRSHLAEAERELNLLAELARLRGVELPESTRVATAPASSSAESSGRTPSPVKSALLTAVIEILTEHGEPMQIRQLMGAVQKRRVTIPGSGQQANLIAYISRDNRIARPRRGFYALREWGVEDAVPAHKRRRTRRRKTGAKQ